MNDLESIPFNVALVDLTEREKSIAELWLQNRFTYRDLTAGEIAKPWGAYEISQNQLPELSQWGTPFLTIGSRSLDHPAGWQMLYNAGCAACWLLPASDPILFPQPIASRSKGNFLLPVADESLRRLFRQIAVFAGFDSRVDFQTADDLVQILHSVLEQNKPVHAFIDLDSDRVDAVQFCYTVSKLFAKQPSLKQSLHIWLMRDFSKPGIDPVMIRNVIKPFAKRIFHPLEALLAMVESLFLFDESTGQSKYLSVPDFRSPLHMLYGQLVRIPESDPWAYLSTLEWKLGSLKNALPFLWLFRFFQSRVGSGSVTLSPEPVIDSGNSFD